MLEEPKDGSGQLAKELSTNEIEYIHIEEPWADIKQDEDGAGDWFTKPWEQRTVVKTGEWVEKKEITIFDLQYAPGGEVVTYIYSLIYKDTPFEPLKLFDLHEFEYAYETVMRGMYDVIDTCTESKEWIRRSQCRLIWVFEMVKKRFKNETVEWCHVVEHFDVLKKRYIQTLKDNKFSGSIFTQK